MHTDVPLLDNLSCWLVEETRVGVEDFTRMRKSGTEYQKRVVLKCICIHFFCVNFSGFIWTENPNPARNAFVFGPPIRTGRPDSWNITKSFKFLREDSTLIIPLNIVLRQKLGISLLFSRKPLCTLCAQVPGGEGEVVACRFLEVLPRQPSLDKRARCVIDSELSVLPTVTSSD